MSALNLIIDHNTIVLTFPIPKLPVSISKFKIYREGEGEKETKEKYLIADPHILLNI